MSSKASAAVAASGQYGRLWARGHETCGKEYRRILSVEGKGSIAYLQGLVTCDLKTDDPAQPRREIIKSLDDSTAGAVVTSSLLRAACFLDQRGRLLTDALLWKPPQELLKEGQTEQLYIDVPADSCETLLHHLRQYKVGRSTKNVRIRDATEEEASVHVIHGTLNAQNPPNGFIAAVDPRHPSLGLRLLQLSSSLSHEERKQNFESLVE